VLKSFAGGALFGGGWGEGTPTVLALHGWRRTHDDFTPVSRAAADLPGGPLSALGPDLPGFGATPPPP
jgi:pimeloyl-ACP methyl ester carboxylesterase